MCYNFFWPPLGAKCQNTLFNKGTFCNFFPYLSLTSDAIFSVIWPSRIVFNTILENYKKNLSKNGFGICLICRIVFNAILENYTEESFQKWFWNLSHVFGSGQKMYFKKTFFYVFCPFYGLTLTYNCSVICQGRMLIFLPKWLILILNFVWYNFFWPPQGPSGQKTLKKKTLFAIFCPF